MKCQKCGKVKKMLGPTIHSFCGTKHKSCGKGLGVTYDREFYNKWQAMRARTTPSFWCHKEYYDRGIVSDEFASFSDFFRDMYPSWCLFKEEHDGEIPSLERIDVDKPYTRSNCKWIHLNKQQGNTQRTVYFTTTNFETGEISYHKNASQFGRNNGISPKYTDELIRKNRKYKNLIFKKITKEEYMYNSKI